MSHYIIKFEGNVYASEELFNVGVAKGERSFIKMLARKQVFGKEIFDQVVYPLTKEQETSCRKLEYVEQDLDDFFKHLNFVTESDRRLIKEKFCPHLLGATLLCIGRNIEESVFTYKRVKLFKSEELALNRKYNLMAKLAAVKLCGRTYIALNMVDVRIDQPVVITFKD